ncbi:MAG: helix-turn-helix domain-containing protein [Bauldia sp.]|nr:helix-turn-helix domain-containing protein [Bauldia sp.]
MNKPIRTTSPTGEEMIILSVSDYDALVEAAEDARDRRIADNAGLSTFAREAEVLDTAAVKELLAAESPLAFWRKRRGLTQTELADRVGVTQPYLAQLEGGKRSGDSKLYRLLAQALAVSMEDVAPGRGRFTTADAPHGERVYFLQPASLPTVGSDDDAYCISATCPDATGKVANFQMQLNEAQARHVVEAMKGALGHTAKRRKI